MMAEGEVVGFLDQRKIVVGSVAADLTKQIAELSHCEDVGSDLLAESRHARLYEKEGIAPNGLFHRFLAAIGRCTRASGK
jgi:hypothetical protein